MAENSSRRLYRAGKDYVLGGVCAGFAEHFAIDVMLLRILWLVLTLFNGVGAVIYVICLILIPQNPEHMKLPPESRTRVANSGLYVGIGIVVFGVMLTLNNLFRFFWWNFDWWFFQFPWLHWKIIWPILLILFGVWFIFRSNSKEDDVEVGEPPKLFRRTSQKKIGGVCAGLATYWNVDVTLVRVGYVLATLFTAFWLGIGAYIVMLFVVPEEESFEPEPKKTTRKPRKTAAKETAELPEKGESNEQE